MAIPIKNFSEQQVKQIIDAYNNEENSIKAILREFKMPRWALYNILKKNNIVMREQELAPNQIQKIIQLYKEDRLTVDAILKRFKLTPEILYQHLRKHHVTLRGGNKLGRKMRELTPAEIQQAIKLYQDRTMSIKEIEKRLKISYKVWYRYLIQNNIPYRGRSKLGTKMRQLTPAEIQEVIRLYQDRTVSIKSIEQRLQAPRRNWQKYLIEYNILDLGKNKTGRQKRQFTPQEVEKIIQMYTDKTISVRKICKTLQLPARNLYACLKENNIAGRGRAKPGMKMRQLTAAEIDEVIKLYQDRNMSIKKIEHRLQAYYRNWRKYLVERNIPDRGRNHIYRRRRQFTPQEVEKIVSMYADKTISIKKICQELKITSRNLYQYLKKNNIPFRGHCKQERKMQQLTAAEIQQAIELYQDKTVPLKAIGERLQASYKVWHKYMKEHNIPARTRGRVAIKSNRLTQPQIEKIIEMYADKTVSVRNLCQHFNIAAYILYQCLKEHNISHRNRKQRSRRIQKPLLAV